MARRSKWEKLHTEIEVHFAKEGSIKNKLHSFLGRMGIKDSKNNIDQLRRYVKQHFNPDTIITRTLEDNAMGEKDWSIAWVKEDNISLLIRNPKSAGVGAVSLEDIREDFKKEMSEYAPEFKKFRRDIYSEEEHLLVIDIADLHVGKLASMEGTGDEYNVAIATERAYEGVAGLLHKARGYKFDKILFVIGNDVLHTDTTNRTTTSGTPQDTDGMWYDNFKIARKIYTDIIESLLTICDVHVVHNPSNHDFMSGFMLADSVQSWFHNCEQVTFDVTNKHRKYFKYGNSLIATSHGDGAKLDKLPLLVAEEAKYYWADTIYRYVYLHHVHSKHFYKFKASEDFIGVSVEYMRSPSGTDVWHHNQGYQHAIKAIEATIHSRLHGQVARLTHTFK